jgi:hypothetical protein
MPGNMEQIFPNRIVVEEDFRENRIVVKEDFGDFGTSTPCVVPFL